MNTISETTVFLARREISNLTPEEGHDKMMSLGHVQPYLLSFAVAFTQELNDSIRALSMFWFFNIYRMFQKASRLPLKQVSEKMIDECLDHNEALFLSLENTHERFLEKIAGFEIATQPNVMEYVVEVLNEDVAEKEDLVLEEDEMGYLFLFLKTVVECLDRTMEREENQ